MIVPFDKHTGSHLHAITRWMNVDKEPWKSRLDWREIDQFEDELRLIRIKGSSSGADFIYQSELHGEIRMFLSDINLLLAEGRDIYTFSGKFEFCKRGGSYGVILCDRRFA